MLYPACPQWLTTSTENVYKENWRPSDERLGILEWNGTSVNLNWINADSERNSFNPRFIVNKVLPKLPRQRKTRYFPENKKQAIAATAYKLRTFGTVLIFVGIKKSVFSIAHEYEQCIENDNRNFIYKNQNNWKAFELACIESYGENSKWLSYAKLGILCHNADLLDDVRLPLERLMRSEKPNVIIATSTLGQGVNLGVSTVIFSTLYQGSSKGQELIAKRDFWNIAGRAGRAFVDNEGKILVALDLVNKDNRRIIWERDYILTYLDKSQIDKAQSGCLTLIRALKKAAFENGLSFDNLIELIADDNIEEIHERSDELKDYLDWIDDGLLSLQNANTNDIINFDWIDDYFRSSLAYIQSKYFEDISGDEVLAFITARTKGILSKVGIDKEVWKSTICSGIPLNSDLQIETKFDDIINVINEYQLTELTLDDKIGLIESLEILINDTNVLAEAYLKSKDVSEIRIKWIKGIAISEITSLEHATEIITKHYSYNLPWVLNGVAKKMKNKDLIVESEIIEELSILVESGLPDLKSVKVYQAGIRSRTSAIEIAALFEEDLWDMSIKYYKNELILNADFYKSQGSVI
jgi:hypothetical protein